MVLSPPLCLAIKNFVQNSNVRTNVWNVKMDIPDAQATINGSYDATNVTSNYWLAVDVQSGFAFKIIKIYTSETTTNKLVCDVEDVDNWNAIADGSGFGNGSPEGGNKGFIFELNDENYPTFFTTTDTPNITWTDNLIGRFNSTHVGGGGSGSSTNSVIIRAPRAAINFNFTSNASNITCPARVGTYISGGADASSFSIKLNSNYYSVDSNFPMFTGNVAFYVGNPANAWTFNQVKFGSVSSTAEVRTQISSGNYPTLILQVDGLHTGTFPSASNDMSNGYSLITTLNFLN
jgi:hypothetical protein